MSQLSVDMCRLNQNPQTTQQNVMPMDLLFGTEASARLTQTPFRCPSFVMATAVAAPYWWQDSESVVKERCDAL